LSVRITVNDEPRDVPDELSLQELIRRLTLPAERLAIELNRSVVRRAEWPGTILREDDRVEIVHFVGGG
jgi:thiamine biosynthesis protein ThiS